MDLINFLKAKGISQSKLAQELGVTPSNVNLWVNGKGFPSYEMCRKLLELGMLVDDLFDIDYRSMHAHDADSSAIEKEASNEDFQARFDRAMAQWLKDRVDGTNK